MEPFNGERYGDLGKQHQKINQLQLHFGCFWISQLKIIWIEIELLLFSKGRPLQHLCDLFQNLKFR